jgi:two-component system, OmpR family, response regulator
MRLVIIEDDRDAADYHAEAFREAGHVADLAADGEEGLAQAVDRTLPKLDGLTVIGTLRSKGIETPALILSALGHVDDRVKGLRAGGDEIVLQAREFRLLEYLMKHAGQVVTRTMLRENVWYYHF